MAQYNWQYTVQIIDIAVLNILELRFRADNIDRITLSSRRGITFSIIPTI